MKKVKALIYTQEDLTNISKQVEEGQFYLACDGQIAVWNDDEFFDEKKAKNFRSNILATLINERSIVMKKKRLDRSDQKKLRTIDKAIRNTHMMPLRFH